MKSITCRECILLLIYQRKKIGIVENGEKLLLNKKNCSEKESIYILSAVDFFWNNNEKISAMITSHIKTNWQQYRLEHVLNAILSGAAAELLVYQTEVLASIVDEYVSLARQYCSSTSIDFCYGIIKNMSDHAKPTPVSM